MPRNTSRTYFVRHLLRMLRRGRATVDLPLDEAAVAPSFQGAILVDMSLCRGCGLCVRACPADALELSGRRGEDLLMRIYHDRCAVCGLCELACPAGAIVRQPRYLTGVSSRHALEEIWEQGAGEEGDAAERGDATKAADGDPAPAG